MERLDGFLTGLLVAFATMMAAAAHTLEDSLDFPLWAQLATDAAIIVLALTLLQEALATKLLESSRIRRLLLGNEYVEGVWVDVVFYPDRAPRIGVVYLGSHRSGLVYSGENLDLQGRYVDGFKTHSLKIDFPKILFHYEAEIGSLDSPFLAGIGAISFTRRNGPPQRFTGYCIDAVENVGHCLIGRRVTDPDDLARLEDPATKAEAARELASPLLRETPKGFRGIPEPFEEGAVVSA